VFEVLKRSCVLGFFVVILGFSLWLFVSGALDIHRAHSLERAVAHFSHATCSQLEASAISHHSKHGTSYTPELRCAYRVDGREYETNTHVADMGRAFDSREQAVAAAELRRLEMGSAFYDPDEPARAVLFPDVTYDGWDWELVARSCHS